MAVLRKEAVRAKGPHLSCYPVNHVKELGLYAEDKEEPSKDL